jgi:hypothetical protein
VQVNNLISRRARDEQNQAFIKPLSLDCPIDPGNCPPFIMKKQIKANFSVLHSFPFLGFK